jgi:predicted transposase YbfD/YdcC
MLKTYLETLTDVRQSHKIKHNLLEIVMITICAVMAGIDSWWQIADFADKKLDFFREKFGLTLAGGAPSHDTFKRVFELIIPSEFEKCFSAWVRSAANLTDGEIVSIDGKTLRGSRKGDCPPLHLVGAWANKSRMLLGQTATDAKSNEITAIPNLLDFLELKGCIITIDAMGTQKDIAAKIAPNNDYVLAVKENHATLYNDVLFYFEETLADKHLYFDKNKLKTAEKAHGRVEIRKYYLSDDIDWLKANHAWSGLNAIGTVESEVTKNGKTTTERRFYITTLTDVKTFATAVRSHWGIENSLHWCLDVTFNEDKNTVRTANGAENFAIVRRIVLNLAKNYNPILYTKKGAPTNEKMSLRSKLKKCEYDYDFLFSLLFSSLF